MTILDVMELHVVNSFSVDNETFGILSKEILDLIC